ncbi:hypothetical protein L195_g059937, partial [Trifolium pratense]
CRPSSQLKRSLLRTLCVQSSGDLTHLHLSSIKFCVFPPSISRPFLQFLRSVHQNPNLKSITVMKVAIGNERWWGGGIHGPWFV